ncbi:MAG: DUF4350 domain-containing protein [Crocinitomicaceae bacterium]
MIVLVSALLIGSVIYYFNSGNDVFETESWVESYSPKDKGPYGTYVFKELLDTTGIFESFIQIENRLEDRLIDNEDENDIYFFIGRENFISEDAFGTLIDFVSEGNTAFISTQNLPDYVLDFFFLKMNYVYDYEYDTSQSFKFLSSHFSQHNYDFTFVNNNQTANRNWVYFQPDNIIYQSDLPKILGKNDNGKINFIEIPFDEGSFFLHTNPYQFSNLSLFRFDGFQYVEDLIHHLPYGKIQWDIYNLNYHYSSSTSNSEGSGGESNPNKRSVFQFIFQHLALTWAFVILALTAFLYAIFKGKRRQNIVHAIEQKENSSLSYIETVSSLYLQERKHVKLIKLQKQSFIDFIGNHYYIRSHKIDDKYINAITAKSGVEERVLVDLFKSFETLSVQTEVLDDELIRLQQKIEHFYKTCK